jgi:peptide/nickel transport system substrate-binding protein
MLVLLGFFAAANPSTNGSLDRRTSWTKDCRRLDRGESVRPMRISRRQFGALASAAVFAHNLPARAANPDVLVPGWDLPANLDPHQVLDVPAENCAFNMYDNLYRYEDNPPQLVPWLAESHRTSPDGLTWEFKLRSSVSFHDGKPVTAGDVVFSFQRLLKIGKAPAAPFLPVLKTDNITAVDAQTVRIRLDRPYGPFFSAVPMVMILNEKLVRAHEQNGDLGAGWLASNEAGSGAYRLIPETYVPLESRYGKIRRLFSGLAAQPAAVPPRRDPADQGCSMWKVA